MISVIFSMKPKSGVCICYCGTGTVLTGYAHRLRAVDVSKDDRMNMPWSVRRRFIRNFTGIDTEIDTFVLPSNLSNEH